MSKIKVLELDQWTSTGNITDFTLEDFELQKVKGGDSKAAQLIFGGHAIIREVEELQTPPIGNVWFRLGVNGKLQFYKSNYDSSG